MVYGLKREEEVEAVEIFVGEFDCRDQNNQRKEIPTMDKDKQERRIGLQEIGMSLDDLVRRGARQVNKAPRRKQRGINYALIIRWLSASLRPKERGIKPAEIKRNGGVAVSCNDIVASPLSIFNGHDRRGAGGFPFHD